MHALEDLADKHIDQVLEQAGWKVQDYKRQISEQEGESFSEIFPS